MRFDLDHKLGFKKVDVQQQLLRLDNERVHTFHNVQLDDYQELEQHNDLVIHKENVLQIDDMQQHHKQQRAMRGCKAQYATGRRDRQPMLSAVDGGHG